MSFKNREWWKVGLIGVFMVGALTMAGETLVEDLHDLVTNSSRMEYRVMQLEKQRAADRALLIKLNATMGTLEATQERLVEAIELSATMKAIEATQGRLVEAIENLERTERSDGDR